MAWGRRLCPLPQVPAPGDSGLPWSPRNRCIPLDAVDNVRATLRTAKERESWEAQPATGQGPGAPISPAWGSSSAQGAPPPSAPRPHPTSAPPESREALEDTRRIHLLKRLHSFTSVLRQHLPDPGLGPECPPPPVRWLHSSAYLFTPPLGGTLLQSVQ